MVDYISGGQFTTFPGGVNYFDPENKFGSGFAPSTAPSTATSMLNVAPPADTSTSSGNTGTSGIYNTHGLFSGVDAWGNPNGSTPLTNSWEGAPEQIPFWAANQGAVISGLGAYQNAGMIPPPDVIREANDMAMSLFADSGYSQNQPQHGRQA